MRTTITLDPDVEALVKRLMRDRGLSFKEAVNAAIRQGLAPKRRKKVSFPTYDLGIALIDIDRASHVAAQLEDEEIIRKLRVGT